MRLVLLRSTGPFRPVDCVVPTEPCYLSACIWIMYAVNMRHWSKSGFTSTTHPDPLPTHTQDCKSQVS